MSKSFSQFRKELNEADRIEPTIGDLSKKEVKSMSKGEPKIGRITKSITNAPKTEPTIGDTDSKIQNKASATATPSKLNTALSKAGKVAKEIPAADVRATNKLANAASSVGQKIVDKISSSPIVKRVASNPALKGASKIAGPLAALDVGLGAGELTRSALNTVGPSIKGDKVKNNAKSGLEFKGDLPTLPREFPKKSSETEPKTKISQSDLGSTLRGEPQTLKTPTDKSSPTQTSSSKPSTSVSAGVKGGPNYPPTKPVKSAPAKSNAAAPVKNNSSVKQLQQNLIKKGANIKADGVMGPKTRAAMKSFSAPANKYAAPATKPAAPVNKSAAPVKKSIPTTRKAEADPNTGKGFVTARSNISKSGEIINPKNRFGSGNKQTFMTPTPRKDVIASGAKAVPQKPASEKSTGTASVPRTSKKNVFGGKWM